MCKAAVKVQMELAVFAVRLENKNGVQSETCRVGFLPKELITKHSNINGMTGIVAQIRDKSSNPFLRQQAYSKFGIAEINLNI
ncbi:hypothetical protein O9G_004518 [Rozella allomycis CSF55]|uniref:Uncharacterized protein n=1 Tax=Rozella allomycis (strain CSF55) TaxID=988480 RepID=A0A075AXJ5_ROZAC|nr:hypothetical protein O9G_004518 [Rozella allomycis CSF55]|eukprot:EPZ33442.1 hypothetical protein O9G_004518 [Rozella allomycis CSF55]